MKRFLAVFAVLFSLVLSGCSGSQSLVAGSSISIAEVGPLISLNADLLTNPNSEHLAAEIGNLTTLSFYSLNAKGELVANTKFGKVSVVSTEPFVVKYEINSGIKWSDGQAVDEVDLLLSFAAATNAGGVEFNSIRSKSGLQYATIKSVSARSLELAFSQPVADFETALTVSVPAHTVAKRALAISDYAAGKVAIAAAVQGDDTAKLVLLAETYSQLFGVGKHKPLAYALVSNGAYQITEVEVGTSVTLKANPNFTAGQKPRVETITLKIFGDATAAVSEMYNGGVDLINATDSGLATLADILSLVAALPEGQAKTEIRNGDEVDTVLLNFGKGSVFADSTYSGHPERAASLRKAIMNLVPKARAVQLASKEYTVGQSDSFIFPSSSKYYKASKVVNGSQDFLLQDVEKASELVKQSGVSAPLTLRVVYDRANPRSKAQFGLLADRAASAGFNVVDGSGTGFNEVLLAGEFDLFIGPMALTGVPGNSPASITPGFTSYEDPEVTALLSSYALSKSPVAKAGFLSKIDKRLFATSYGMPLLEVPNLVIYGKKLTKFTLAPYGNSLTWGYWTWSVSTN